MNNFYDNISNITTKNDFLSIDGYLESYKNINESINKDDKFVISNINKMQNNNTIFNYPDYILITLLLEQFTLKDLIKLDTSVTNKKLRKRLHNIFRHPVFILKYHVTYIEWLSLRNIKCEDIKILPNIIHNNLNQYDKSIVIYCVNNGTTIKKLDVSKISMFREDSIEVIKSCKNLTHFTFDCLSYHPGGVGWGTLDFMINLKYIYNTCQNLKYISFDPAYISFDFDDVLLQESCSKIESIILKISNYNYFRYDKITKILSQCKNLKNLEVEHLEYMIPGLFLYLADNFKKLECLNIQFSSFWRLDKNDPYKENKKLANINLRYLVDNLKNIKHLNVLYCNWLYYDTLKYIYSNCEKNEYLYLIDNFSDKDYDNETNIKLIESVANPLNIKYLTFNSHNEYNIFPSELLFSKFKNLESFNCYYSLKDDDILLLVKNCKNIKKLELGSSISDISIFTLANNLKNLTSLSVSSLKITDLSMIQLFRNCKLLETIQIIACENLTDLSFTEITNCRYLKKLKINDKISNECIKHIVSNCYILESISIYEKYSNTTKKYTVPFDDKTDVITFELVLWIMKNAHNLKNITFLKQNSLTNDEKKLLLNKYGERYFPTFISYLINNR